MEKTNYTADEKGYQTGGSDIVVGDHGADCELQRRLSTRHITMIALGSSIGMGLWLGSGTSLASGGPASIFIGYLLSGTMIWSVSHSIGEMAVMYPLPSAFIQWSNKFVDPAAGFALGGHTGSASGSPSQTSCKELLLSLAFGPMLSLSLRGSLFSGSSLSSSTLAR